MEGNEQDTNSGTNTIGILFLSVELNFETADSSM